MSDSHLRKRERKTRSLPGIAYGFAFRPYSVVVCSIDVLHKLYDKEGDTRETLTHLIVDEASQVPDSDLILALGLLRPNGTKFVMFGDERPGPFITEDDFSDPAVSMFERVLKIKTFKESSVSLLEN